MDDGALIPLRRGLRAVVASVREVPDRPVFLALYLLGAEVFCLKWGRVDADPEPRGVDGGGATGSHELGFVMDADAVVARETLRHSGPRPC